MGIPSNYNSKYDFEEFSDSAQYKRRHNNNGKMLGNTPRTRGSAKSRSAQARNKSRNRLRENRRRIRIRNRAIIISTAVIIVTLIVLLLTFMFRGCSDAKDYGSISTETKSAVKSAVLI